MVKGIVGTMLKAATKKQTIDQFIEIIQSKNPSLANFAIPSHGLTLMSVNYWITAVTQDALFPASFFIKSVFLKSVFAVMPDNKGFEANKPFC